VKRWRERDIGAELDQPQEEKPKPLWVEQISPRTQRERYGLPALIVGFLILAFVVATVSHFEAVFSPEAATPTPGGGPSPIPWVNTLADNGPQATPSPIAGQPGGPAEGSASPAASAGPYQSGAILSRQPKVSIRAQGPEITQYWKVDAAQHFTLNLTNTSTTPIPMDPCPTYRMYFTGTIAAAAPVRLLNCAAASKTLEVGQTMSFDMVYTLTGRDPVGNQTLVWELMTPSDVQAITFFGVFVLGSDSSAP
jgi:hypothetical protein